MSRAPLTFVIPAGTRQATCRACDAPVFWITTRADKKMPASCDGDGLYAPTPQTDGLGVSHFSDCPAADAFRSAR